MTCIYLFILMCIEYNKKPDIIVVLDFMDTFWITYGVLVALLLMSVIAFGIYLIPVVCFGECMGDVE